jgi:hypothetical protein
MERFLVLVINWVNGGGFKLHPKCKKEIYFSHLYGNTLNLDKALAMSTLLNGEFNYTPLNYKGLSKFGFEFHIGGLSELITSLNNQLQWMYANDGMCNGTNRVMHEAILYRLDTWCLTDMEKYNYISLIVAWKRALTYIQEINKLTKNKVHRSYVNRSLFFELDTFLKLTEFILEEELHE